MVAKRDGVQVVWNRTHAYSGDLFECPLCNIEVIVTNPSPYYMSGLSYNFYKELKGGIFLYDM